MSFKTTHVGSLPRIDVTRVPATSLTEYYVRMLVGAGIDEINDGEINRGIYFGNVIDLPGFAQNAYPRTWPSGDVMGAHVVIAPIQRPSKPLAAQEVSQVRFALSKLGVQKRVKVTVPSTSMMSLFYPPMSVKDYPKATYLEQVKGILVDEAIAAFKAGADTVQFDAPTLFTAKPEERKALVALDNELLDAVRGFGTRGVHCCWGNYWNTQLDSETPLAEVISDILELRADIIGPLEVYDGIRDYASVQTLGAWSRSFGAKKLAAGIVSVKSRNVEPVSVLRSRRKELLNFFDEDKLVVSTGCGFASTPESIHSFESAKRKLTNLCEAAK